MTHRLGQALAQSGFNLTESVRLETVTSQSESLSGTGGARVAPQAAAAGSGALPINDDELSAAFDFLDVDGSGRLTGAGIKHRLGAFFSNLPQKEIKLLLGEGPFTKDSLRKLLATNDLGTYDPVREAFRAYDPNGTGFADPEMLRSIFETLGYGPINEEDIKVLIETADADRDGKIGLEDFRKMMKTGARPEGAAMGSGIAAMKGGVAPPES